MAALLRASGHEAVLWSPSGRRVPLPLVATGALSGRYEVDIAESCGAAIAGAEAVLVAVPGFGHRRVMDAAAPHLRDGQIVVISSHCSLSALYLSKLVAARGIALPIVAWGT